MTGRGTLAAGIPWIVLQLSIQFYSIALLQYMRSPYEATPDPGLAIGEYRVGKKILQRR